MLRLFVAAMLAASLLSCGPPAYSQHPGHAEHHEWYRTLKDDAGFSCCNERDCRPTRAYLHDDGRWRAELGGVWVIVPDETVLRTRAPDGNSHICANRAGKILCFVGGEPKS